MVKTLKEMGEANPEEIVSTDAMAEMFIKTVDSAINLTKLIVEARMQSGKKLKDDDII